MAQIQFIQTTPESLKEAILYEIKDELNQIINLIKSKEKPPELLTKKEVAHMLKISQTTVHNWTKTGELTAHFIGSRRYYKRNEIINKHLKTIDNA